jgi:hypothetical protein
MAARPVPTASVDDPPVFTLIEREFVDPIQKGRRGK